MSFNQIYILFIAFYLTLPAPTLASININEEDKEIEISKILDIAQTNDSNYILNIEKLKFNRNIQRTLALGYQNGTSIIKFQLNNNSSKDIERFLLLNSINGTLSLYFAPNEKSSAEFIGKSGTDIPLNLRPKNSTFGAIKFKIPASSAGFYYLTIKSVHNINGKLFILDEESLTALELKNSNFLSFYAGGIILLALYNLFIYFILRDKTYLFYFLFSTSFMLTALTILGTLDIFIPITQSTWARHLASFSSFTLFASSIFSYYFLDISHLLPKFKKYYHSFFAMTGLYFIIVTLFNIQNYAKQFGIFIDLIIFFGIIFFIMCAILTLKKSKLAWFYVLSYIFVLISLTFWFGANLGLLPINFLTQNSLPLGSTLEMLTLALALAYKIQILTSEKKLAQSKARAKDQYEKLLRVMTHDVANSLTVVNSYAKKLVNTDQLEMKEKGMVEKIYRSSENIKNLLQKVREQEKLFETNETIKLQLINLFECIHFSKLLYEELAANKNITIELNIPDNLFIMADKTCFMNNIVNNLLSNAIKFSLPTSKIVVEAKQFANHIEIDFIDHGVGIEQKLIEDIFYAPKIITSLGTSNEIGTGIGTNLLREYVTLFKGSIEVESKSIILDKINHGTKVKIIFPNS